MSRKVIGHDNDKKSILKALHEESGHRGTNGTQKKMLERYWWRNVYRDTKEHVQSCDECQRRLNDRVEEVLHRISRPQYGIESVLMLSTCRKACGAINISLWPENMCQDGRK